MTEQSPPTAYPPDVVADVVFDQILTYVAAQDAIAIVRLVQTNEAAEAARAAEEAAQRAPAPQVSQAPASGDCYSGTPIPAYIIDRESGGNPSAVNPSSGAYGCFQLMPEHFNGGTCSDLDRSLAGQKACAIRLYNAGGLSPWAL